MLDATIARKVADLVEKQGTNVWFEKDDAWWAQMLGLPAGTSRRNDTLDVWLDSGTSHVAVLQKTPELQPLHEKMDSDGKYPFRPADVYIEATDQHRGWFQSSLMTSVALHAGRAPYRTVITHGFVVDKDTRKKVSKSAQGTYAKPMDAAHFVNKYGADIVRLWAASVEFTNEVPFSEESFAVLADAYRQFRNVLRILLANASGGAQAPRIPNAQLLDGATTVDLWMLSRLQGVIATCREAYAAYDFRKVFQAANQFVTVDVSALYVDITKDRLYCDAANSPRRMATQEVMGRVFDALARLLAPILAFTADEAWEFFGHAASVHVETFPELDSSLRKLEIERRVEDWLELRGVIAQAIEPARQEKIIGNALEASVTLEISESDLLHDTQDHLAELEEFVILSDLRVARGDATKASLAPNPNAKCMRCWRYRLTVGQDPMHPDLCDRCAAVVKALPPSAST